MNTNGIGNAIPRPITPRGAYGLDTGNVGGASQRTTFPTRTQPAPVALPEPAAEPAALKPPKGTDPELWKVLTADERAFFAREDAMGPLSYGHRISSAPTMPSRGGRLNLRG